MKILYDALVEYEIVPGSRMDRFTGRYCGIPKGTDPDMGGNWQLVNQGQQFETAEAAETKAHDYLYRMGFRDLTLVRNEASQDE